MAENQSDMQLFAAITDGAWTPVFGDTPSDKESAASCKEGLNRLLVELLRSENVIVLTGLGTSLCLSDNKGKRIAPTMSDLWDGARNKTGDAVFDGYLTEVNYPNTEPSDDTPKEAKQNENIELLLSQCHIAHEYIKHKHKDEAEGKAKNLNEFIADIEHSIVEECSFVNDDSSLDVHESFLRRIARRSTRLPRTKIFTTNYDLCFESAASRINFVAVDGFSHSFPQQFDSSYFAYDLVRRNEDGSTPDFIPNVFHLYKMHGSVDWQNDAGVIRKQSKPTSPVLVFPRYSKFEASYEHPFLEFMARFQSALRQPKTSLLIIGFGFNDKHITQPILSAIRSNVGLRVAVVDPSLKEQPSDASNEIQRLIKSGDQRLALVSAPFEEFVPLLPDLIAETEEERHRGRLLGSKA